MANLEADNSNQNLQLNGKVNTTSHDKKVNLDLMSMVEVQMPSKNTFVALLAAF
jgi:hypothetical protein